MIDLWMTVEVKDKPMESAYQQMQARKTLVAYLEQQLGKLESGKIEVDVIEDTLLDELCEMSDKDMDVAYTDLVARNSMIGHTEMQIAQFQILAGQSAETVEETKARLGADSSK